MWNCLAFIVIFLSLSSFSFAGLTPFGYAPSQCVHPIFDGESLQVLEDGSLKFTSETSMRIIPPCPINWMKTRNTISNTTPPNGWTAYAEWVTSGPVNLFNGYWVVPGAPTTKSSQTLFLFTGLQNALDSEPEGISIIQPVLQWGASECGNTQGWAICSWFVGQQNAVYSAIKSVNSNDKIVGNMTLDSNGQWTISTQSILGNQVTTLTVNTGVQELYAFVTLEVYGITTCTDFPSGSTTFGGLFIDINSVPVAPKWSSNTQQECNEKVVIVSPSIIQIQY